MRKTAKTSKTNRIAQPSGANRHGNSKPPERPPKKTRLVHCLFITTAQLIAANDEAERLVLNRQLDLPSWLPALNWPIRFHMRHVNYQGKESERILFNLPSKPARTVADVVKQINRGQMVPCVLDVPLNIWEQIVRSAVRFRIPA